MTASGGRTGVDPARPALIAITRWVPNGRWDPQPRGLGVGGLALLSNSVAARSRTDATLAALTHAVDGATVLEGDRGEASGAAKSLLATLESLG